MKLRSAEFFKGVHSLLSLSGWGKYGVSLIVFGVFLIVSTVVRIALMIYNHDASILGGFSIPLVLGIGFLYDCAVGFWWALPFAVIAFLWPGSARAHRAFVWFQYPLLACAFGFLTFISICEFAFWGEYSSRYNFIAVDYLIYTREVIGTIKESYPVALLWALLFCITIGMLGVVARSVWRIQGVPIISGRRRVSLFCIFSMLPVIGYFSLSETVKGQLNQPQLVQFAGNGCWDFFHAFHQNSIDYDQFYSTVPKPAMAQLLREEYAQTKNAKITQSNDFPIERDISSTTGQKKLNIVLISVESLGAEYIESLGGAKGLVPHIEALGHQGLWFSRVYATGTRTVRGLEALTLSIPPTPGHAILMRPKHSGLATLGGVLKNVGYEPIYLYGGYSYFDNMNAFFTDNGYTVVDRSAIASNDISHETVWGVADEDLFKLAIKEVDARFSAKKPFFAHVMTTSNHRPFTFPENRIDLPNKTRAGAVKYTDFAISQFFKDAQKKPWFDNTIFVVIADHTSIARGRTDLPLENYHIPLFIYSPKHIKPSAIDSMVSQIDVAPTILGLVGVNYRSRFFGRDVLAEPNKDSLVYMANYQTIGVVDDNILTELKPNNFVHVSLLGARKEDDSIESEVTEAKSLYQFASSVARDFVY